MGGMMGGKTGGEATTRRAAARLLQRDLHERRTRRTKGRRRVAIARVVGDRGRACVHARRKRGDGRMDVLLGHEGRFEKRGPKTMAADVAAAIDESGSR